MATYTISTTDEEELAITRQMKIDNAKLLERNQTELDREQWMAAFVKQQLYPLLQQMTNDTLNRVMRALSEDPVKLAQVAQTIR